MGTKPAAMGSRASSNGAQEQQAHGQERQQATGRKGRKQQAGSNRQERQEATGRKGSKQQAGKATSSRQERQEATGRKQQAGKAGSIRQERQEASGRKGGQKKVTCQPCQTWQALRRALHHQACCNPQSGCACCALHYLLHPATLPCSHSSHTSIDGLSSNLARAGGNAVESCPDHAASGIYN